MRILLVGNHWTPGPGGAEAMLVLTADLLRRAGHDVVPLALAEEGTLPTPVADLLPRSAKDAARTRLGEAGAGGGSGGGGVGRRVVPGRGAGGQGRRTTAPTGRRARTPRLRGPDPGRAGCPAPVP